MAEKQPTIQNFIASMNRSGGFARTSKYAVIITPPSSLKAYQNASQTAVEGEGATQAAAQAGVDFADALLPNLKKMSSLNSQVGRQINLHCNTVSMPGHDLQAQDQQHGSAPGRQIVQSHDYAGFIDASFYLDVHMRERHFFEQWQKMAVNTNTHKANYYDDYIGTMEIFQLDGNGEITYGIKATEVYPATIAGIEYAYENTNQIATQAVKFQYRQWFNMTADTIAGYNDIERIFASVKTYGPSDIETTSSAVREKQLEKDRQRRLRSPNVDKGPHFRGNDIKEAKRQEQLRSPEVDKQLPNTSVQQEKDRQKQLRTPEIDRQGNSRRSGIKESKRQEQLRPPNSK